MSRKTTPQPAYLTVRTVRTDDPRIALDEQDERHPGGYVHFAHDGQAHEVGDTPRVRELCATGEIEIVESEDANRGV